MSHFSVLVVGENVAEQLAPFDERRATPPRREYVSPKVIASMARAYDIDISDLSALAAKMPSWRACPGGVDARGLYAVTTYNQDGKFDEYEVGGRWADFFLLKPGAVSPTGFVGDTAARAAVARKGDVDFDRMRSEAEARARDVWRVYAAAIAGTPDALPAVVFDAKVQSGDMGRDAALRAYRAQPRVRAFRESMEPLLGADISLEDFPSAEEDYVSRRRRSAVAPFALVYEGVWRERGSMGWFGSVANARPDDEWYATVDGVLTALPDNALLTLVDCHV